MKVFISGGTGFVGTALTQRLVRKGYDITILTRRKRSDQHLIRDVSYIEDDSKEEGDWQRLLADQDIIINLAGASIFRRWSKKNKNMIWDSRILTTRNLVKALIKSKHREALLISTSAVGYYGFHNEEELSEDIIPGTDFLASLGREWENEARKAEESGVRVVICRFGIILGRGGGALNQMVPIFNWYMGAQLGNGNQYFSWIHLEDLVDIYLFLIDNRDISGPVNCTSPHPVKNRDLTKILSTVLKKPVLMPAIPGFMIRLFLGEFGNMLIKGQKALPIKLMEMGYQFRFPEIKSALEDIEGRKTF